ncbi:hypothetical protein TNCV_2999831 [Trichonephila clavipes]|nr:hypothetical protein TNCV_2999831 [Trichonephila clavipes]
MEGFVRTNSTGSRHLRTVSRDSRVNSYSNKELVDVLIMYGHADIVTGTPLGGCTRNITRTGVFHITRHSQL